MITYMVKYISNVLQVLYRSDQGSAGGDQDTEDESYLDELEDKEFDFPEGQVVLPVVPLRGMTVLPNTTASFEVARSRSLKALEIAMNSDRLLVVFAQSDMMADWPKGEDMGRRVVCIVKITETVAQSEQKGTLVHVRGLCRAVISTMADHELYSEALVKPVIEKDMQISAEQEEKLETYRRELIQAYKDFASASGRVSVEGVIALSQIFDPIVVGDIIASNLGLNIHGQNYHLEELDAEERLHNLLVLLRRERRLSEYEKELEAKVREEIEAGQKEYYLREQLKVIHTELGDQETSEEESDRYLQLLAKTNMPERDKKQIEKEINRLSKYPPSFPEANILRNYLDLVFELPWGMVSKDSLNIKSSRRQLDKDHYGLEKVKERVLEYLAVLKRQKTLNADAMGSQILCFVGPPGVGKTSVAQSIAKSMGRQYIRMSLGGVRDEAEIRGHRRTYIGAMPGRLINSIKRAGTDNPLILMDEIDKLGNDFRGDPASALLEVLDPAQNVAFRDHYLEIDYDLSKVMFITTANSVDTIPRALLDRMELIEINGYTEEEKYHIARLHLWPRQLEKHAIDKDDVVLMKPAIMAIIRNYTREAGVRQLEQELAHLCRRIVLLLEEEEEALPIKVSKTNLDSFLGKAKFHEDEYNRQDLVGLATGLAWTSVGGDTLAIEVNTNAGSGKLELTGRLGEVMQESAKVALAYIRSQAVVLGINPDFVKTSDIHIHVPEGAVPKDGPSAGITLATAILSALSDRPVRHNVAMTGEITIRGRILPIGGLKEKVIAAHRAGIDTVLVPTANLRDLDEIPESVKKKMTFHGVSDAMDVFRYAILPEVE